jgi:archaellum component FlaD/FlaE
MVEGKGDSRGKNNTNFDYEKELSILVQNNKIPSRIAERLTYKLKEKNIQITKNQLYTLVYKIQSVIQGFGGNNFSTPIKTETGQNQDMKRLFDAIEKIEERLSYIETGDIYKKRGPRKTPKFVTTDDIDVQEEIKIPESSWEFDPLTEVPNDPESVIVLMKWLQYLIDKCGRESLANILDYYVDIGWISQDAKISLIDYSHGITEDNKTETTTRKEINDLPSKDHIQSLVYIQKLKGYQLDKHFLDRIDGELNRINKKVANYNLK